MLGQQAVSSLDALSRCCPIRSYGRQSARTPARAKTRSRRRSARSGEKV